MPDDDMAPFEVKLDGVTFDPASTGRGGSTPMTVHRAPRHRPRRRRPWLPSRRSGPTSAPTPAAPPLPPGVSRLRRGGVGRWPWSFVGLAIVVGLWQLAASSVPELPTPADTFGDAGHPARRTRSTTTGPTTRASACWSASRCSGCSRASAWPRSSACPLGLPLGASRRAWQAFNPVVQLLRPVSPLAWFPIWLVVLKDAAQAARVGHLHHRAVADRAQHRRRRRRRSRRTSATWPGCSASAGSPTCATC